MIHYTCDGCKRILDPDDELRYVIRMEVRAAMDSVEYDDDREDRDYLLEVHEVLESADDLSDEDICEDIYQQLRFDLCPECYRRFIKDPIGKEKSVEFNFSQN